MAFVLKTDTSDHYEDNAANLAGFNLSDLADEGRQQLDLCRQEAEQILADAKRQADLMREEAIDRGYQDGLKRATEEIEQQIQQSAEERARTGLDLVRSAVDQLHQEHEAWMTQYSETLVEMTLAATERIVRHQLELEPELLVQWAEEAVRSTRTSSELAIAVNPETLAQLGQALDEMLAAPDLPENTRVVPDHSVATSEVVVRPTGGEIRAGLIAQLRRLEELLS